MIVGERIAEHALRNPAGAALVFDGESLSWSALEDLVGKIAAWLERRTAPGRPIALCLPSSPTLVLHYLAGIRLGREVQILDSQWPSRTVAGLLMTRRPALVLAKDAIEEFEDIFICGETSFASMIREHGVRSASPQWPHVDPRSIFYTGFTSGTTGLPKGFRRTHRSWLASFDAVDAEFGISERDIVLAPGSLSHSLFLFALSHALHVGATSILCKSFRPDTLLESARRTQASVLYTVPSQAGMLIRQAKLAGMDPVFSVKRIISSGSKWKAEDTRAIRTIFPNASLSEFYGTSETSFVSVAHQDENIPAHSVGRAFSGVSISIRDDLGDALPPGQPGNVFAYSNQLFSGYANDCDEVLRAGDGAIATGDIGYLDEGGRLFLSGRRNRMIVVSGKNVYPEEIETALESCDGISHAAVIGMPDSRRGEKPVAIIQSIEGRNISRRQLVPSLRRVLPLYKIPRIIYRVEEWPTTRSGKTDFSALAGMIQSNEPEVLP